MDWFLYDNGLRHERVNVHKKLGDERDVSRKSLTGVIRSPQASEGIPSHLGNSQTVVKV